MQPVVFTVVGVLAGAAVLAALTLTRFVANPVRAFRSFAVLAAVVSFAPDPLMLVADPRPSPAPPRRPWPRPCSCTSSRR